MVGPSLLVALVESEIAEPGVAEPGLRQNR